MTNEDLDKIECAWASADRCDMETERSLVKAVRDLNEVARSADALTSAMVAAVGSCDPLAGIRVAVIFCELRTALEAIRPAQPTSRPPLVCW